MCADLLDYRYFQPLQAAGLNKKQLIDYSLCFLIITIHFYFLQTELQDLSLKRFKVTTLDPDVFAPGKSPNAQKMQLGKLINMIK